MIPYRVSQYQQKYLHSMADLEDANVATINCLAFAIEARDPLTRGHSERVATYAVRLAEALKLDKKRIQLLRHCCRLHDVGKIGVSDTILLKPGKLTLDERGQIEMHPVFGTEILSNLSFISKGLPIILHHHERYDGRGYPHGLKRDKIPLEVKIITIADAFDAMTSNRPYRSALSMPEVLRELKVNSGTQFDPKIMKVFLKIVENASIKYPTKSLKAA